MLKVYNFGLGLRGQSAEQMDNLLGSENLNNVQIGETLDEIFSEENEYELDHANRIYVDAGIHLRKTYKAEVSK